MVTAIVPTCNDEQNIGNCLASLLGQRGVDDYEIIVVDGRSADRTVDIVRSFEEFGTRVRLIDNPQRYNYYAWNIGCHLARGDYIAFINSRATYSARYFRDCLDALERTKADAIGPVQAAVGNGVVGRAIAWCMSNPMGVGNARFRFTRREEEVESVFSMFLRREIFERLGGCDERIAFDDEAEFSVRLRAGGGKIFVSPSIRVNYFVCETFRGLARQMLCYGYGRRFTQLLHPRGVPVRVYVPPTLIAAFCVSLALAITPLRPLAAVVPMMYLGYVAAGAFNALPKIGAISAACILFVLPCMHFSYGYGFWRGLLATARMSPLGRNPGS